MPHWTRIGHDSHRGFYRLLPAFERTIDAPAVTGDPIRTNERIHWTVIGRYMQDLGYRPGSLVKYVQRNQGVLEGEPKDNELLARP